MAGFEKTPRPLLRLIHLPPRLAYTLGLGPLIGKVILLLTTRGRKSGRPRVTPLQYEEIDGCYYLAAALGNRADWVRNIRADPQVKIQVGRRRFSGRAEIVTDPAQIADYLENHLRRHPRMVGAILRSEGLHLPPGRAALEEYAARLILVVVHIHT